VAFGQDVLMASNLKYKETLKNTRLDAITTAVGSNGLLRIYSGTQPADPDAALAGNSLLTELALSAAFAGTAPGAAAGITARH